MSDERFLNDHYLLGDGDPELERLRTQHRTWWGTTLEGLSVAELDTGERVLDVGCGPGFVTLELADIVGETGSVTAIDPSDRFTRHLEAAVQAGGFDNVDIRHCGIEDLEEELAGQGRFDLIHVRWVLCFLPDPAAAIATLAKLLRPGGRLVTLDYFNYRAFALAPRLPEMETVVQAVFDSWTRSGGSLEVQGETPRHCENEGLELIELRQVSGLVRPGDPRFDWPETFLATYLPRLVAEGLLEAATADAFLAGWTRRRSEPGTFLYLPPLLRVIAVKPPRGHLAVVTPADRDD